MIETVREAPFPMPLLCGLDDASHPDVGNEPVLAVDQIQGNILAGFNKDFQTLIFLHIDRAAELTDERALVEEATEDALALLGHHDHQLHHQLDVMKSITVRAGPFQHIHGTFRNNILYLDKHLLQPSQERELIVTIIHEAGAALGRPDVENERRAQEAAAMKSEDFRLKIIPQMMEAAVKDVVHTLSHIQGELNKNFATKIIPRISFHLDTAPRYVERIEEVIRKIHNENDKNEQD